MKIAYVIVDGLEQFVLAPENETEQKLVNVLTEKQDRELSIHRGKFHETEDGFVSMSGYYSPTWESEKSAIVCLRPARPSTVAQNDDVPEAAE